MPASYHIDVERRLITTVLDGRVTDADFEAYRAYLTADPQFDPAFDHLLDARGITHLDITSAAIRRLAQTDSFSSSARRAIVVSADVAFGMARMFQSLSDRGPEQMTVVRQLDEALRWLDRA